MIVDAIISFTTDFGLSDSSVGQCKGVIASISPRAIVVDISHSVPHFDIMSGSWMLRSAVRHFPQCVHVAVIDPGVGTKRRPIAISARRGDVLIGPDNGLLIAAAEVLGGVESAVELSVQEFRHHPVSNTFHARDIFCPAAAHVSHGVTMHLLGPTLELSSLVRLPERESTIVDGAIQTTVIGINEFGSLALAAPGELMVALGTAERASINVGDKVLEVHIARTFGDVAVGESMLFVDSYGRLCIALNQGDLAATLGLARTDRPDVRILQKQ
jgi:S-adenosylmethionine hydrolase